MRSWALCLAASVAVHCISICDAVSSPLWQRGQVEDTFLIKNDPTFLIPAHDRGSGVGVTPYLEEGSDLRIRKAVSRRENLA
eukprot:3755287-Rhodomonas_salina.1